MPPSPKDLWRAAENGQLEVVRRLLDDGLEVSSADSKGRKPLYLAAHNGHVEVVRLLLDRGADATDAHEIVVVDNETQQERQQRIINLYYDEDIYDNTALSGNDCCVPRCSARARESGPTPCRARSKHGNIRPLGENTILPRSRAWTCRCREAACRPGTDINVIYRNTWTPLLVACQGGHRDVVKLLVERGANIHHAVKKVGFTALCLAAQHGYTEIVRLLAERGADIDKVDGDGQTPLVEAAARGNTEMAMLLAELGANVHARPEQGYAALHLAALHGALQLAKLLIDRGADMESSSAGAAPLLVATQQEHAEIVKLLEEAKDGTGNM